MVDKRTAHEASIRIPLLVRYPALGRGKRIQQQVLTVDVGPSVLELCEAKALANTHGKSWVKMVRSGDPDWRKSWLYEYNYEKQFPYTPNVRAIRTDQWKYIHYPHGDGKPDRHPAELYDLEKDPDEIHNLAAHPDQAPRLASLQKELAQLLSGYGLSGDADRMPLDEGIKKELPDQKIR
jgi:N-acetylglucosamine-6-sulfatase